jgi:hypothetical protein
MPTLKHRLDAWMIPHSVNRRAFRASLPPGSTVEEPDLLVECWHCLGPDSSLSIGVRDKCRCEIGSRVERSCSLDMEVRRRCAS